MIPKGLDGKPAHNNPKGSSQLKHTQNMFREGSKPQETTPKPQASKMLSQNSQGQSTGNHNLFYQHPTPDPKDRRYQQKQEVPTPLIKHLQRTTAGQFPADPKTIVIKNENASTYFVPKGNNYNPNRRTCK